MYKGKHDETREPMAISMRQIIIWGVLLYTIIMIVPGLL